MNNNTFVNSNGVIDLGAVNPDELEIGSEFISLACITVLAVALGSKTHGEKLASLNYGRALVIALYALSWAFAVTSTVIVSTNDNNLLSCTLGMLGCDVFYAGAKIAIYMWLMERVHVVTAVKTPRLKTGLYKFHILLLCPYVFIFVLMLTYRRIYLEPDGKCTIGLMYVASIPLLVYDFILNFYLTWLFLKPLMSIGRNFREDWKESRLYKLARRTLVASIVCLAVSFINVLGVVLCHGQRGLICLSMCTLDVTINVATIHWVTTGSSGGNGRSKGSTDGQISVDMTFEQEDDLNFDAHIVHSHKLDDEDDSVKSQTSTKPINNYY